MLLIHGLMINRYSYSTSAAEGHSNKKMRSSYIEKDVATALNILRRTWKVETADIVVRIPQAHYVGTYHKNFQVDWRPHHNISPFFTF